MARVPLGEPSPPLPVLQYGAGNVVDNLRDLTSGRDAGMVTVGVLTGTTTRAELEAVADVVLADIGEIERWLG